MGKISTIQFKVELDDNNIPERIHWLASDQTNGEEATPSKALLVSLFSEDTRETLRFDIWTNDMQIQEMDRLIYYTLKGLADTYQKATHNNDLASDMQQFANYFGEKTEIIKPEEV
jgi:gliding motility-associated protein GldC